MIKNDKNLTVYPILNYWKDIGRMSDLEKARNDKYINFSEYTFIIPARGGQRNSKKNIKSFAGQPLISYSIDIAKKIAEPKNILVTTDDLEIADFSKKCGVAPPFIRPKELAMDDSSCMMYIFILLIMNRLESFTILLLYFNYFPI